MSAPAEPPGPERPPGQAPPEKAPPGRGLPPHDEAGDVLSEAGFPMAAWALPLAAVAALALAVLLRRRRRRRVQSREQVVLGNRHTG